MFEVKSSHLSSVKRLGRTSSRLTGVDGFQSLKQEPKAHGQFEQRHRRIEDVVVHDFVEVGKDQVNDGAEDAPRRRDHTEDRQSFRNLIRLKPHPRANRSSQAKERQADIIIVKTSGELDTSERLEAVRFENF